MTHDSQSSDSTANAPSRGAAAVRNWLIVLLALGIGWRLLRYLLCFPFWLDEAYLNTSVLRRDYAGVLEPLYYFQIAPLLYLWVQRTVFLLLGGGEYALRLYSLLTGIGALLLFWRLVRPHLDPIATNVAVGFFACSYYLVRHTCESKPYASDLLVATLLIWLAVRWWQTPASARWPLLATLASVPAVWLSYPGVFVACGVSLATLVASVRSKRARAWALWLVYNVLVAASFLCFLLVFVAVHSARAADSWLEDWWRDAFPPRASIGAFLWWLVKIHTGRMFAYPHGGPHFASTLTTVLFLVGAITLVVRRRHWFVLLFVGMSLATLLAAALERYPYGGSVRVSIYFAPLICLMAGLGAATLIDHVLPLRARDVARGGIGVVLVGLAIFGMMRDALGPYKAPEDAQMRAAMCEAARAFRPDEVVAIVNPQQGNHGPLDGPEFHPVLRYYFELYSPVQPTWRQGGPLPADADWIVSYKNRWFGPERARVEHLARVAGLRVVFEQSYALSERWPSKLTVYRCATER